LYVSSETERFLRTSTSEPVKSTGKEGDNESGLDHFQFRKYSSALARFMSPN
jgi:RHS repeat-associated protein